MKRRYTLKNTKKELSCLLFFRALGVAKLCHVGLVNLQASRFENVTKDFKLILIEMSLVDFERDAGVRKGC